MVLLPIQGELGGKWQHPLKMVIDAIASTPWSLRKVLGSPLSDPEQRDLGEPVFYLGHEREQTSVCPIPQQASSKECLVCPVRMFEKPGTPRRSNRRAG